MAEFDPLMDDGVAYWIKMKDTSSGAQVVKIEGSVHPFLMLEELCKEECERAYSLMGEFGVI